MNSDKVIKGIEHCLSRYIDGLCDDCPYMGELDKSYMIPMKCKEIIMRDALALLKEQEAVEPKVEKAILDYQSWHYICGDCGGQIDIDDNYCRHCGRVVAHLSNKI